MIKTMAKPKENRKWSYPRDQFSKMYAPPEEINPADKLRSLLSERFKLRHSQPEKSYLHTAGAYDAMTASILTDLGYQAIYASGWQLAVSHSMYPDIGIYPSHSMVELTRV